MRLEQSLPEDAGAAAGAASVFGEVGVISFDGDAGGMDAAAALLFGAAAAPPEKNDAMDFCIRMRGATTRTESSVVENGLGDTLTFVQYAQNGNVSANTAVATPSSPKTIVAAAASLHNRHNRQHQQQAAAARWGWGIVIFCPPF